jgi:hypothetical protein
MKQLEHEPHRLIRERGIVARAFIAQKGVRAINLMPRIPRLISPARANESSRIRLPMLPVWISVA